MIYQIKDKYYINVAPYVFRKINLCLKNEDLVLVPTDETIEVYKMCEVKCIYFQNEKENLKRKLFPIDTSKRVVRKSQPRKRR